MVRLVFRPYTQFRRSICTSESLRSSIRVSPDFDLTRHSSPSFGSQHVCSWYLPTARALGHSGQSRIGRQNRAGRTRTGAVYAPALKHAWRTARQPRAQAKPARPTTDLRDGVRWQVPGLRPPAYRRPPPERGGSGLSRSPGTHGAGGWTTGERFSPRATPVSAPLWCGKKRRRSDNTSRIGPGVRRPESP